MSGPSRPQHPITKSRRRSHQQQRRQPTAQLIETSQHQLVREGARWRCRHCGQSASAKKPPLCSWQVLGIEALITKEVRSTHKLLIDHINALRQVPELATMRAVLALESNLAYAANSTTRRV